VSEKLKVGIIGVGAIGTVHVESYQATGQAEVAAICDIDAAKLAKVGDKFNVKSRFEDYHRMLESDIDAVSVCVGNALHREVAIEALQAGKHVLLEKPMAMNAAEAADIAAAGEKAKGILQIAMCQRQNRSGQILREYVEAGLLGEIYHIRTVMIRRRGIPGLGGWFTTKAESGGGPMIDLGVHWFDMAMWLSGRWNPTAVSAKTYAKFGPLMGDYKYVEMWAGPPRLDGVFDVEDYSAGFVRFGDTASMSFEIVWAANTEDQSFVEILGDKGGARVLGGKGLTIRTEHNGRVADITPQYAERGISELYVAQAETFLAACRGERAPLVPGEQGVVVMKLIDAIYASSDAGKEVAVEA